MEVFTKIVNGLKVLTIFAKNSILGISQGSKCASMSDIPVYDLLLCKELNQQNFIFLKNGNSDLVSFLQTNCKVLFFSSNENMIIGVLFKVFRFSVIAEMH